VRSSTGISAGSAPAFFVAPPTLGVFSPDSCRVGRNRRQVISFGLQLLLDFLDRPIELLVFRPLNSFPDRCRQQCRIDAATFNDPLFAVVLSTERIRVLKNWPPSARAATREYQLRRPCAFPDQFAEPKRLKAIRKYIAIGSGEFVGQCDHRARQTFAAGQSEACRSAPSRPSPGTPQPLDHQRRDESAAVAPNHQQSARVYGFAGSKTW